MANSGIGGVSMRRTRRQVTGEPWEVTGFKIQPVARLRGWHWTSRNGNAGGGVMHLSPTEVVVQDANGGEQRLALSNPNKGPLFGMLAGAVSVAVLCSLVMLVVSLIGAKRLVGR
jgi:hypothetical protein